MIVVELSTEKETATPLIVTPVTAEELKFVPVMVILEPLHCEEGEKEVNAGGGVHLKIRPFEGIDLVAF